MITRVRKPPLLKRQTDSHKGDNGKVVCVGGSSQYVGAVGLTGISALRSGADLSVVYAPTKVGWALSSRYPDLIVHKLSGNLLQLKHYSQILKEKRVSSYVLGNGAGKTAQTQQLMKKLSRLDTPKVIDADALHAINPCKITNAVLTPHRQELAVLLEKLGADRQVIKKVCNKITMLLVNQVQPLLSKCLANNNVIVIKGSTDYIISKHRTWANSTGNASMTKGGTGDVLAGCIAGFIAQGDSLEHAACKGCYYTGKAGDLLVKNKKYAYLASELAEELVHAIK